MAKHLVTIAIVAFGILITYDIVCLERPKDLRIDNPSSTSARLNAHLQVKSLVYELASHSLKATVNLYVKAVDDRNIDNVAFSLIDTGSREWLNVAKKRRGQDAAQQGGDCQLQLSEELDNNKTISSATLECKDTVLATGAGTEEILYPFDSYQLMITPVLCINSSDGACGQSSKAQSVFVSSLGVGIGDQNLIGDFERDSKPNSYALTLRRRFFVRMVSVTFLIMSLSFLAYIGIAGDPNDLLPKALGFFGTLWALRALIVPSAVTIFPTVVDFSILTIFCVLFMVVLRKFIK